MRTTTLEWNLAQGITLDCGQDGGRVYEASPTSSSNYMKIGLNYVGPRMIATWTHLKIDTRIVLPPTGCNSGIISSKKPVLNSLSRLPKIVIEISGQRRHNRD